MATVVQVATIRKSYQVYFKENAHLLINITLYGICPLTGDDALSGESIRNTLSLMHSSGMYDYSGQFAFKVCGMRQNDFSINILGRNVILVN